MIFVASTNVRNVNIWLVNIERKKNSLSSSSFDAFNRDMPKKTDGLECVQDVGVIQDR